MPVPDYQALMFPVLRSVADGKEHAVRDVRDQLAAEAKLFGIGVTPVSTFQVARLDSDYFLEE